MKRLPLEITRFVARLGAVCVCMMLVSRSLAADVVPVPNLETPSLLDAALPLADRVVVDKSERRLYLYHEDEVLRSYRIALGLHPIGHKQYEGDFRTPEGEYRLVRRNGRSDYFLSIQVSYPNEQDIERARRIGRKPGGAIMIHGLPNTPRKSVDYYARNDWTDGCIAVTNSEMVEIWLMTPPDTPIQIRP
jgi:murein L,D-transpeptidase YafK